MATIYPFRSPYDAPVINEQVNSLNLMASYALTQEKRIEMIEGTLDLAAPRSIEDFTPGDLPQFENYFTLVSTNIISAFANNALADFSAEAGQVSLSSKGKDHLAAYADACVKENKIRVKEQFQKFLQGQIDTNGLTLPSTFNFQLLPGDVKILTPQEAKQMQRIHVFCKRLNENSRSTSQELNSEAHNYLAQEEITFRLIHGMGDLYTQMQFLHFIGENIQGSEPVIRLPYEVLIKLRAEFFAQDPDLATVSPPKSPPKRGKKKRRKRHAQSAAPLPPKPTNERRQIPPSTNRKKQDIGALNRRLNAFNQPKGCKPDKRLIRWSGIANLLQIRDFIDYDPENLPQKQYELCSLDELRMHKENHDIPMHTILREESLVARYSTQHKHESARNGTQYGRLFFAEKISHNLLEKGVIATAFDANQLLFHCQFVPTARFEPKFFETKNTSPEANLNPEEKDEEAPFQFQGNYHIEINEATEAILIKIGQDGDPDQVIYRILPLK